MREISPTSVVTIGIVITTILGLLHTVEIIDLWLVPIPIILLAVYILGYTILALIEEFK